MPPSDREPTPWPRMSCGAIDIVLTGAFEWRELDNLMRLEDGPRPGRCSCRLPPPESVLQHAHALCHEGGAFAEAAARQLDLRYGRLMKRLEAWPAGRVTAACRQLDVGECPDVAGFVWAVARDARSAVHGVLWVLLTRVQRRALQGLHERTVPR